MERVYCFPLIFLIISTAFIQIPMCFPSVLVGGDAVVHPPNPTPTHPPPPTPSCQNRNQSITFPVFPHFSPLIQDIVFLFGAGWPLCLFLINAGYRQATPLTSWGNALAQGFHGGLLEVPLNLPCTPSKFCHNPGLKPGTS